MRDWGQCDTVPEEPRPGAGIRWVFHIPGQAAVWSALMIPGRLRLITYGLVLALLVTVAAAQPQPTAAQEMAEPILWGLDEANVLDLALNPDGGVFIATNRGVWQATSEGLPQPLSNSQMPAPCVFFYMPEPGQCNVPSIAVDSNGALYAVVGSLSIPTPVGFQNANAGLYRLERNGSYWQPIARPDDFDCVPPLDTDTNPCFEVASVAIGPDDSIYVRATWRRGPSPPAYDAIYRSTNGGIDWDRLPRPPATTPLLFDLAVGPSGRIWLTGGYEFQLTYMFLITSADRGQTWTHSTLDPGQREDANDAFVVSDFAFALDNTYVTTVPSGSGVENPDYPVGVYRSDDGGETWHRMTEADASQEMGAIAVSAKGEVFHSQRGEIRVSRSNGATWEKLSSSTIVPSINTMAIDSDGILWIGTVDGLFRTDGPVAVGSVPPTGATSPDLSATDAGPVATGSAVTSVPASAAGSGDTEIPGETGSDVESGMGLEQFKSDCFAAGGGYYEFGDGAHGCLFPDGSELDCTADGACQLKGPAS